MNYDNSPSVRLAQHPSAVALSRLGLLTASQRALLEASLLHDIRWGSALSIRHDDNTVDVVYASHMLEHLDRSAARQFLAESLRVLRPGGMLRLAVPDLSALAEEYRATGDANAFVERTLLATAMPRSLPDKARWLVVGSRHHAWMYDSSSLVRLVEDSGFISVRAINAGETGITDPGSLNLFEREEESIYVEGSKG